MASYTFPQQRLSFSAKKKNDYQWGKDVLDSLESFGSDQSVAPGHQGDQVQ